MSEIESKIYKLGGFPQFDSAYEGFSTISHDKLYFALCTHDKRCSAGVFSFDFRTKAIELEFSMDQVLQSSLSSSLPHGKIHTKLFTGEEGNLYFGTHFAYPDCIPQDVNYEGGRIIAYDPISKIVDDHGVLIKGEGIITMEMDRANMHCYVLTSPSFYFVDYDLREKKICYITQVNNSGSSICRSLGLDSNGNVYGSSESFNVFRYNHEERYIDFLETNFENISEINKEWISPNKKGSNRVGRSLWRCLEFDAMNNVFYGINASDSTVFEFDISSNSFHTIGKVPQWETERIYPTLAFAKHNNMYYYVPANGRFDYKLSEDIWSTSALISFNSKSKTMHNHGLIYGPNREMIYGSSSAISKDNKIYLIGAVSVEKVNEKYNHLEFQGKRFELGLIEIDLSVLNS